MGQHNAKFQMKLTATILFTVKYVFPPLKEVKEEIKTVLYLSHVYKETTLKVLCKTFIECICLILRFSLSACLLLHYKIRHLKQEMTAYV